MQLGLMIPHIGNRATPERIRNFCMSAEASGISGLWGVDHIVMPYHSDSDYVLGRSPVPVADGAVAAQLAPNYEMMTTLAWVAGFTSKMTIGTSVAVLPIRNTLIMARQMATLDVFTGGRTILGVGAGWLREEAESMGMPWDRRGARLEEQIRLLRGVWSAEEDIVEFHGAFHDVSPMDPEPRPIQRPIPIYVGGHSDTALERAGRIGDGWISASLKPDEITSRWQTVRHSAESSDRDPADLRLIAQARWVKDVALLDQVLAYQAAGVHHLQIPIDIADARAELDFIRKVGGELAPALDPIGL